MMLSFPFQRSTRWIAFFTLVVASWLSLFLDAATPFDTAPLISPGFSLLSDTWSALCRANPLTSDFKTVFMMWSVMSVAMMAPTLMPALTTYDDLIRAKAGSNTGFVALIAAYLAVWIAFSLLAATSQLALGKYVLTQFNHPAASSWITASLFALAGGYQLSKYKSECLKQCQQPLTFFMQHWQNGILGAAKMGTRLGLVCVGCCWALMCLALISGAMSLVWMGLATLFMVTEKLPQFGELISKPLGYLLLVLATVFVGRALAMNGLI
jgi:predicted metal-binding membrane protein